MQETDIQQNIMTTAYSEPAQIEQRPTPPTSQRIRRATMTADLLKAHVTLIEKEVILASQADLFRLVQHHYYTLQAWHDQHTGWRIQRNSHVIRLERHLNALTPGYLYERLKEPKDFACLTWLLWYSENRQLTGRGNEQQFLLSQLAEQIQEQSALDQDGEEPFDFRRPADRYSMQRALHYLEDLGGLQLVDGQTREWVEQAGNADVLYEFTPVARSLVAALNPQAVESAAAHLANPATALQPTLLADMARSPSLVRAWRGLLLGPTLFRFDDPSAFAELLTHAESVANELLDTFGWLLDIQRDYACIVRASGMALGPIAPLTPYGTNDQIALLLCQAIRTQVETNAWPPPDAFGCLHVSVEDMSELFYSVREQYGEHWGNEARGKSSRTLLQDVYKKMRQVGLLRGPDEAGQLLILPTAARYAATYEKPGPEAMPTTRGRTKANAKRAKKTPATPLPGLE
ncbi:hypothetical protein KSC_040140 [Ktedonobacter sp. SOSP1-52]|uniref:TIGR02678 family protein n=1 Tax=Ktedonobacter sp. SOSP1-52 TaxID=2778366 RepID=UPI00191500A1|nr:TIGR02678 family protein [Ktedonobacter sp. SOSP1-52]GHO65122.1 hypothetical protein KSC_040140 [Ktedonobacter sp. SOSP1-52]